MYVVVTFSTVSSSNVIDSGSLWFCFTLCDDADWWKTHHSPGSLLLGWPPCSLIHMSLTSWWTALLRDRRQEIFSQRDKGFEGVGGGEQGEGWCSHTVIYTAITRGNWRSWFIIRRPHEPRGYISWGTLLFRKQIQTSRNWPQFITKDLGKCFLVMILWILLPTAKQIHGDIL